MSHLSFCIHFNLKMKLREIRHPDRLLPRFIIKRADYTHTVTVHVQCSKSSAHAAVDKQNCSVLSQPL